MEHFVLVEEYLLGLLECLYSNSLVEAAWRALLIVSLVSGSGDRYGLGALEVPVF